MIFIEISFQVQTKQELKVYQNLETRRIAERHFLGPGTDLYDDSDAHGSSCIVAEAEPSETVIDSCISEFALVDNTVAEVEPSDESELARVEDGAGQE